ncbi:hypothetical protein F5Y15DRAFT_430865 [Xylariaceae sp. FL0016]|nr:hypothetical protein F5Y15DRAFT_430865 [Xylariaceae sp. FL0016]
MARKYFTVVLRRLLINARGGSLPHDELRRTIESFQNMNTAPRAVLSILAEETTKSNFRKEIIGLDGHNFSTGSNVYVLYFTRETQEDHKSWKANKDILFNLLKRNSGDYVVVVAECTSNNINQPRSRITFYKHYQKFTDDMLKKLDFADQPFARHRLNSTDTTERPRPLDRRLVRLRCPFESCSDEAVDWYCYTCRLPLEYHDHFLYCDCGRSDSQSFTWQCSSPRHGPRFTKYDASELRSNLEKLHSYKDMNVLILGETGVGKSTWINAFYNYIMFKSLDDARAHEKLEWVIPSSFSLQEQDEETHSRYVETSIKVGEFDDAEMDGVRGDSATQQTGVYRIPIKDTIVRLIDTPGIGDVRGVDADRENLANILQTLSRVRSLHGIIILMKPNAARLNLMFRFCVKELLTYLHRDAARNMVWGFTNTRYTNFSPGDTFKPLQRLLEEHKSLGLTLTRENTFCFDAEGFRGLAIQKQAKREIPNFEESKRSWERSAEETTRLLDRFASIKPHPRTITLNQSQIDDLKSTKDIREALNPRTVCKQSECVSMIDIDGLKRPVCTSVCHDPCYLNDVQSEVVGHPNLVRCAAFNKAKVNEKKSAIQIKQAAISSLEMKIGEFVKELQEIRDAAGNFALFLKQNSIAAYNDAMIAYLEELIKEGQTISFHKADGIPVEKNEKRLLQLKSNKREYEQRIKLLSEQLHTHNGSTLLDEQGVEELIEKLYALPHWGQRLRDMQQTIEWSKASDFREKQLRPKIDKEVLRKMTWLDRQGSGAQSNVGTERPIAPNYNTLTARVKREDHEPENDLTDSDDIPLAQLRHRRRRRRRADALDAGDMPPPKVHRRRFD